MYRFVQICTVLDAALHCLCSKQPFWLKKNKGNFSGSDGGFEKKTKNILRDAFIYTFISVLLN